MISLSFSRSLSFPRQKKSSARLKSLLLLLLQACVCRAFASKKSEYIKIRFRFYRAERERGGGTVGRQNSNRRDIFL